MDATDMTPIEYAVKAWGHLDSRDMGSVLIEEDAPLWQRLILAYLIRLDSLGLENSGTLAVLEAAERLWKEEQA